MKRIALVTFLFDAETGGAATVVRQLAEQLVRQDIEVIVITTHSQRRLTAEHHPGMTVYRFLPLNLYWIGEKEGKPDWLKAFWHLLDVWNPHVYRIVRTILKQEQPELVHVHKLRGLSPSVWSAAHGVGIPTLQTCHDYELVSPEGTFMGRIGALAKQRSRLLRPYQDLRARLSKSVAAVSAPSHYTLKEITSYGFFTNSPQFVIANSHGFSQSELEARRERLSNGQCPHDDLIRLLYLGRLEEIKGIALLCEAFLCCAQHQPNLHLNIAGWGEMEPVLRERYGAHPQITFHGAVFGETKASLLIQSDVMIVPSIWGEVFGLVVVEAFAHGVPVIASDAGALPELIEEGVTGYLFAAGDKEGLINLIRRAAENIDEVREMRSACFAAARRYAIETMTQTYLSLYDNIRKSERKR